MSHVPSVKANFVALTLVALLVLEVVDGIATFRRREFSQKLVVVL